MRLVINRQGNSGAGLNRYKGTGIYSSIGRKVLLSGLRNVTNAVEKANRSQLIADAVVNGYRHETVKKARNSVVWKTDARLGTERSWVPALAEPNR